MKPSKFPKVQPNIYRAFMTGLAFKVFEPNSKNKESKIFNISYPHPLNKFELSSTTISNNEESATEIIGCLWPFLRLARLIGMCPIVRTGNHLIAPRKYYHPSWIISFSALGIQSIMLGNGIKTFLSTFSNGSTDELVNVINNVIYYSHTLLNCFFMIWNIREFPKLIIKCKRVEIMCKKYAKHFIGKDNLVRDSWILLFIFTSNQFVGNALYYVSVADKNNVTTVGEFFHAFNEEFISELDGSYISGIFFCFGELLIDMGWTFGDMMLGMLSLIMTRYFVRLNYALEYKEQTLSLRKIESLRIDHREICQLVHHCNELFSPLFLLTYLANVGYLFSRLYTGLADDLKDPLFTVKLESLYAFCYQIFIKILLPSYLASVLHEKAHEGLELIHNWPSTLIESDSKYRLLVMGRFVSQLVTTQTGISGCGYFLISKNFMVTLISALITYEVIILQFQAAAKA